MTLEETPVFKAIEARGDRATAPVSEVFKTETRALVAAALCRVGPDVLYGLFTVFVLTYITTQLGLPRKVGADRCAGRICDPAAADAACRRVVGSVQPPGAVCRRRDRRRDLAVRVLRR